MVGRTLDKPAANALEPELKELFQVLIASIKRMAKEAIPKNRPVTYVFQVHGEPNLEFIARTRDTHAVITALTDQTLSNLDPEIHALHKRFGAEMIQFCLGDDGCWRFNYLLTSDGKVIGTKESFDRRAVVLRQMEENRIRKKDS